MDSAGIEPTASALQTVQKPIMQALLPHEIALRALWILGRAKDH